MYESTVRVKEYQRSSAKESVHCANCGNAKRVLRTHWRTGETVEKVTCSMNQWEKGTNGKGAFIDYYAVHNKTRKGCNFYDPMGDGDLDDFIDSLPQGKRDYLLVTEGLNA